MVPNRECRSRRFILSVIGLFSAVGLSGCMNQILPSAPVQDVDISVVDVRAPSIGMTSATIEVVLNLRNRADRSVPNPNLSFDIFLSGQEVGSSSTTFQSLEPKEEATKPVGITVEFADLSAAVAGSVESGEFDLLIRGTIESDGSTETFTIEN